MNVGNIEDESALMSGGMKYKSNAVSSGNGVH